MLFLMVTLLGDYFSCREASYSRHGEAQSTIPSMALHVNLSQEAQARLAEQAAALGMRVEDYAAKLLEGSAAPLAPAKRLTGKELVEYWRKSGVIGSRPDIKDSVAHARKLRRQAERRRA